MECNKDVCMYVFTHSLTEMFVNKGVNLLKRNEHLLFVPWWIVNSRFPAQENFLCFKTSYWYYSYHIRKIHKGSFSNFVK
jgi:hypothetical protein